MSGVVDWPLRMVRAEIASGKATIRSVGALYMVAMANRAASGVTDYSDINGAIADWRCPSGTPAERAMSMEPVKKVGWALYEAVCAERSRA